MVLTARACWWVLPLLLLLLFIKMGEDTAAVPNLDCLDNWWCLLMICSLSMLISVVAVVLSRGTIVLDVSTWINFSNIVQLKTHKFMASSLSNASFNSFLRRKPWRLLPPPNPPSPKPPPPALPPPQHPPRCYFSRVDWAKVEIDATCLRTSVLSR